MCPSYCTLLFTLLTVSEVLVMHAPYHSQYKVKYAIVQGASTYVYTLRILERTLLANN